MTKKLFDLLKKANIVEILNIEDSYFKTFNFKNKKKISKEVVLVNYSEYSPYDKFDVYYNSNKQNINIWYTDKTIDSTIVLPESYLLSNYYVKNGISGLILIESVPKKLLVIKDGELKRQFSKKDIATLEIELIKKEFLIENTHIYTDNQYAAHLEEAVYNISFKDMMSFFSFELNYKNILSIMINKVSIPLAVFISLLTLIEGANYFYVKNQLSFVEDEYKAVKKQTMTLKENVDKIDMISQKYTALEMELQNSDKVFNAIKTISGIVHDANATFKILRITDNTINITIETNQTSSVFTKIVNSETFSNLKIQNTKKDRRSNKETVAIKGEIKW